MAYVLCCLSNDLFLLFYVSVYIYLHFCSVCCFCFFVSDMKYFDEHVNILHIYIYIYSLSSWIHSDFLLVFCSFFQTQLRELNLDNNMLTSISGTCSWNDCCFCCLYHQLYLYIHVTILHIYETIFMEYSFFFYFFYFFLFWRKHTGLHRLDKLTVLRLNHNRIRKLGSGGNHSHGGGGGGGGGGGSGSNKSGGGGGGGGSSDKNGSHSHDSRGSGGFGLSGECSWHDLFLVCLYQSNIFITSQSYIYIQLFSWTTLFFSIFFFTKHFFLRKHRFAKCRNSSIGL